MNLVIDGQRQVVYYPATFATDVLMNEPAPVTSTYTCPDGTPFEVRWPEPGMETFGWRWDQMHCPLPFTPLSDEWGRHVGAGFASAMDATGVPGQPVQLCINGYRFSRQSQFPGDPEVRAAWFNYDLIQRIDRVLELWNSTYCPEVEALTTSVLAWEGDPSTPLPQLMHRIDQLHAARRRHGELHTLVMGVATVAGNRFLDWCKANLGAEGEQAGDEMTRGFRNKSLETSEQLWSLSRQVLAAPAVADLLRTVIPSAFLLNLRQVEGGNQFAEAFTAFLEEFGHRSEAFIELSNKTWFEDPRFPLFLLKRYLDAPANQDPTVMHEASVAARQKRVAEVEASLTQEQLAIFRQYLVSAQQRTVLLEDHNFYIDQKALVAARTPGLAIARRLVGQGAIDAIEDIWYLQEAEMHAAAANIALRLQQPVAERKRERERWMRVLPPTAIGSAAPVSNPALDRFYGSFEQEPEEAGVVKGIAGSRGICRGVARLILSLDDIDRLEPGDILVTYATAPTWTPLFAIAGGIVTDAGGPLSHCAVVAREYGIPAVVGCRTATARIADGALITVDGDSGRVRIEG